MLRPDEQTALTQVARERRWAASCADTGFPRRSSSRFAEPGGAPVRIKLLGELLVAFRDPTGKAGV